MSLSLYSFPLTLFFVVVSSHNEEGDQIIFPVFVGLFYVSRNIPCVLDHFVGLSSALRCVFLQDTT